MSRLDNNPDLAVGMSAATALMNTGKTQHWKYPETVGNDTIYDDINFNSHESSEYSVARMNHVSETTHEPFMLFEFMTIDEEKAQAKIKAGASQIKGMFDGAKSTVTEFITSDRKEKSDAAVAAGGAAVDGFANREGMSKDEIAGAYGSIKDEITDFITDSNTPAERNYTGSVALYMPTDIQINDSMVYNEDTRKLGAALNSMASGEDGELINWVTATDPAVMAAGGAALAAVGAPAALSAVIGGTLGVLIQGEMQRHTGKVMNPNELVKYSQTALRTFTFNWTMLPDNENESMQAAGLIKFFRKSAHAKRSSSTLVTVPDHVVTSFHGAKDMIQLPPCFIESVNVTYNPNNSSFFRRNNSPVEIGLSVSLKEIVPIYALDIDKGY